MDTETIIGQINRWMEDGDKDLVVEVMLELEEKRWVVLKEFRDLGTMVEMAHVNSSWASNDQIELLCDRSALKAVRRRKDIMANIRGMRDDEIEPLPF